MTDNFGHYGNRLENLRIYSANVNFNTPFNYLQRQKGGQQRA